MLWVDSLLELLNCLTAACFRQGTTGLEGVSCIRLRNPLSSRRSPLDEEARLHIGPPPFSREAVPPSQAEAQQSMASQAWLRETLPVPSADPIEESGFSAEDFHRAARDGLRGRPVRPSVHRLFGSCGHFYPEAMLRDLEHAVEDIVTQMIDLAFRVHPDITRPSEE